MSFRRAGKSSGFPLRFDLTCRRDLLQFPALETSSR